jgi:iron complex transport system substrate-binding protein
MKQLALLVVIFSLLCCTARRKSDNEPLPDTVGHFRPRYAQGFDWKVLADSSYQITFFNLESPGDTLQVIRWKRQELQRVACLSTTHIPYLSALNCLPLVRGAGFADRMKDSTAREMYERGEILNLTTGNELEPEAVFVIEPELLFVYPFGGKTYEKFLSEGIGCVQISEYLEKHPLGRAEWIRLFGLLLNRQAQADSIFADIEGQYLQLRDSIAAVESTRPVVFAGSMDGDRWAVPSGNSYLATLIYDAGGTYLFQDSSANGNLILPFESFYAATASADFWGKIIYEENAASADVITQGDDRLKELPSFKNKRVFACNALATDYHGQALLEPHLLLQDLHRLLSNSSSTSANRYFKQWDFYD